MLTKMIHKYTTVVYQEETINKWLLEGPLGKMKVDPQGTPKIADYSFMLDQAMSRHYVETKDNWITISF